MRPLKITQFYVLLVLVAVLGCSCGSTVKLVDFSLLEQDVFVEAQADKTYSSIHFRTDHTFHYEWGFWDGHRFGNGHWKCDGNDVVLAFDEEPSPDRKLEGITMWGDTIVLRCQRRHLTQIKHIDAKGRVNLHPAKYKAITEEQWRRKSMIK